MKIITAHEAAALIQDDWVVTTGGFGHCGSPEALLKAVEQRFLTRGSPVRLTLFFASGPGDRDARGVNRLAHRGLIRRIVGGFWSLAPRIGDLALANEIEAHNWPQGVVSHMFRAIAGSKPGVLTEVGLGTFIDPAQDGGCLNQRTGSPLVERMEVAGAPALLYKAMPIQCALLRGTRADEAGNISMEREANIQDVLAQAQAVRNSGGIVIVQVQEVTRSGSLPLPSVCIPGFLVDYVVVASAEDHWQTYGEEFNPAYCGQWQGYVPTVSPVVEPLSAKRIIARRALHELLALVTTHQRRRRVVVNLGIGTPEAIAREARASGLLGSELFTLTVESGAAGGIPAGDMSFGATAYPDAMLTQAELFDYYDGGGIDLAFLGFGQIDAAGRVNVASLGRRLNGVGGFINISQAAQQLVFCGTYTAGGLAVKASAGEGLRILNEGRIRKMVPALERICYDPAGRARCKTPLLITERAVFRLSGTGLELVEVAPGIDVERDILAHADIDIRVAGALRPMPASVLSNHRLTYPFVS
jgi:propionate CoA-transferase